MASTGTAAQRWNEAMAEWAIPAEILDAAPRRPFAFIPEMFAAPEPGTFELSLSNRRAAEALGAPGGRSATRGLSTTEGQSAAAGRFSMSAAGAGPWPSLRFRLRRR